MHLLLIKCTLLEGIQISAPIFKAHRIVRQRPFSIITPHSNQHRLETKPLKVILFSNRCSKVPRQKHHRHLKAKEHQKAQHRSSQWSQRMENQKSPQVEDPRIRNEARAEKIV